MNYSADVLKNILASLDDKPNDNMIILLGKGPSLDNVNLPLPQDIFTIGINDAERINPCDISLLRQPWCLSSVQDNNYASRCYVSPFELPDPIISIKLNPYQLESRPLDIAVSILIGNNIFEDFYLDKNIFISALYLCKCLALLRNKRQEVILLGFDFAGDSLSSRIDVDYADPASNDRSLISSTQSHIFEHLLYALEDTNLSLQHVGFKPYSVIRPADAFNGRSVDNRNDDLNIVAEFTTNHFGDSKRLKSMVQHAYHAGATSIKLQKRTVELFYSQEALARPYKSPFGNTFRDYRNALELNESDFQLVDKLCLQYGLDWFVSVLDIDAFEFMLQFNPKKLKLPSTISKHASFIKHVSSCFQGDIVISTGMTDQHYEKWILELFKDTPRLYLMQCNSAYPTPDHHCNIRVIQHYQKLTELYPNIIPGYSSHDNGWLASCLAVASGAKMVEKHVKLGNTEWAHFDSVALDMLTNEFYEYVKMVRRAFVMLGSPAKMITDSEHHKYPTTSQT